MVLKLFEDVLPIPLQNKHEVSSQSKECTPGITTLYLVVCAHVLYIKYKFNYTCKCVRT